MRIWWKCGLLWLKHSLLLCLLDVSGYRWSFIAWFVLRLTTIKLTVITWPLKTTAGVLFCWVSYYTPCGYGVPQWQVHPPEQTDWAMHSCNLWLVYFCMTVCTSSMHTCYIKACEYTLSYLYSYIHTDTHIYTHSSTLKQVGLGYSICARLYVYTCCTILCSGLSKLAIILKWQWTD